jgi:hypothetical protein
MLPCLLAAQSMEPLCRCTQSSHAPRSDRLTRATITRTRGCVRDPPDRVRLDVLCHHLCRIWQRQQRVAADEGQLLLQGLQLCARRVGCEGSKPL